MILLALSFAVVFIARSILRAVVASRAHERGQPASALLCWPRLVWEPA